MGPAFRPVHRARLLSSHSWLPTPGHGNPGSASRGIFWPESTDAQALTNLRRELHHLREILAKESSLVVTSRDLCWRDTDTCRVDLRVFATARSAAIAAGAAGDDAGVLVHAATAVPGR